MEPVAPPEPVSRAVILKRVAWTLPIAALAFWVAFRGVHAGGLWDAIKGMDPRYVLLSLPLMVANIGFRLVRWGLIVRGYDADFDAARLGRIGAIGFMAIDVFPARLGEFVRPVLLRRAGVPFGVGMASIVLERLLDVAILAGLLIAVLTVGDLPDLTVTLFGRTLDLAQEGRVALLILMATLGIPAGALLLAGDRGVAIAEKLARFLPHKIADLALGLMRAFVEGLRTMGVAAAGAGTVLTILTWVVNVGVLWCLASAVGVQFSAMDATVVTIVVSICLLLPSPAGGLGVFEAGGVAGMLLYISNHDTAAAFAVTLHAVHVGMIMVPGVLLLPYEGIRFSELWTLPGGSSEPADGGD
ncbi:MAG: flippase-like domain-containing protein [Proteobacteria bacterium]|nr:flippase-like domain-containing protein [Pseudomonadota bacterium]